MAARVGLLGLGAMGRGMAASLARKGLLSKVFDVRPEACEEAVQMGAERAASPSVCAEGMDFLVVAVLNAQQVSSVLFDGPGAVFAAEGGSFGGTCIVCSTVSPAFIEEVAARIAGLGAQLVDAPMSGGSLRAGKGELTFMVGGETAAVDRCKPVFDAMGKAFIVGPRAGLGSSLKMVNQVLAGTNLVTAAEGMALAARLGLDTRRAFEILSTAAGNSFMFENRVPHMLDDDPTPHSALDIWPKDLGIVMDEAKRLGFPCPMTGQALQQYLAGKALGLGPKDDSFVVKVYETLDGSGRTRVACPAVPVGKQESIVEVYDEPRHKLVLRNAYCNAILVSFPVGDTTMLHRHKEDSLYFFLNQTKIENRVHGEAPLLDEVSVGEVRFGAHKAKPLVHAICNCGPRSMLCLDAEVLASPPVVLSGDWELPQHHTLIKTRDRARVYQLSLPPGASVTCTYPFSALVVVATAGTVSFARGAPGDAHYCEWKQDFSVADVLWRDGPVSITQSNLGSVAFDCFIAEWR